MYHFDFLSLIIYVSIGLLCCYWVKQSNRVLHYVGNGSKKLNLTNRYYLAVIFLLVIVASARDISVGTDTVTYKAMFNDVANNALLLQNEALFRLYTQFIRAISSNFRIYLVISYGLIGFSYILFINTFLSKHASLIPLILLAVPFVNSLNTFRSSLAIAVALMGVSLFKNHKFCGFIFMLLAVFVHRMMVVFALFPLFYCVFNGSIRKMNGMKLFWFVAIMVTLSVVAVLLLRNAVVNMGLLNVKDTSYLQKVELRSFLAENYVTLFPSVMLFLALIRYGKYLGSTRGTSMIKILCVFDIIIIVPSLILGLWRINQGLYLARIVMWGNLLTIFINNHKAKAHLIKALAFCIFMAWLVFRIVSMNETSGFMPYIVCFD